MNERILKLLKQSGAYDYYEVNPGVDGDELPMIKFAQLIVRECSNMAEAFYRCQYDFTGDLELHEFMRKHFGVEE